MVEENKQDIILERMPPQGKLEYRVYENHHSEYASGHTNMYGDCKKWQGLKLPAGEWHGPFDSKAQATAKGAALQARSSK